jgi:hypothetical protein
MKLELCAPFHRCLSPGAPLRWLLDEVRSKKVPLHLVGVNLGIAQGAARMAVFTPISGSTRDSPLGEAFSESSMINIR